MEDLIIIGAGPAGLTAAIYAARFRLKLRVFEKFSCGGQILLSPSIENYPGFPEGISTFDLMERFKAQAQGLGVEIEIRDVLECAQIKGGYCLKTDAGDFETKTVIIASGASPKKLGVKGEEEFIGKGVSYCGTCDGPLFKDKEIIVVGGGDRALEDALYLANYANRVSLLHRRSEFRASRILVDKAKNNAKINFILDSVLEEVFGERSVNGVLVKNVKTQEKAKISCAGVFIFVGIMPNTGFIRGFVELDQGGFVNIDQKMQSSREGVFACGDCAQKSLYQVVSACGEGAGAADSAHKYLLNK